MKNLFKIFYSLKSKGAGKIFFLFGLLGIGLLLAPTVLAQEKNNLPSEEILPTQVTPQIQANAGKDQNVAIQRKVLFDASASPITPEDLEIVYEWDFGDGAYAQGVDVIHIYNEPGNYRVKLKIRGGGVESEDEIIVSVYNDLLVMITDKSEEDPELQYLTQYAVQKGLLIIPLQYEPGEVEYMGLEKLTRKLSEASPDIKKSNIIITWTSSSVGLDALAKLGQQTETLEELSFNNKAIVAITDKSFGLGARVAQTTFDILQPEIMVLTREEALEYIIQAQIPSKIIPLLRIQGIEFKTVGVHSQRTIDKLTPWNFASYAVNFMINKGVPTNTILLILMLPLVATIIAFARQILGIKAFGIYIPSVVALSFVATGLKYGLAIFVLIIVFGTLMRLILQKIRMLHLPRIAIVLTLVSMAILAMLAEGAYHSRTGLIAVSIFPMLIMIILVEQFVNVQAEKGARTAIKLTIETLILSVICYFIVTWETLRTLVIAYPEVIFITIVLNFALGKWTGLRVSEYFRFRKLIKVMAKKKEGRE